MTDLELHEFFEDLVKTLRSRGVLCAITSGLACVHYGIAESTQDCEQMLLRRDPRGWLHIYDAELLQENANREPIPEEILRQRPSLKLIGAGDDATLRLALKAERELWQELDRLRLRIMRRALRPYVTAVGRALRGEAWPCPNSIRFASKPPPPPWTPTRCAPMGLHATLRKPVRTPCGSSIQNWPRGCPT